MTVRFLFLRYEVEKGLRAVYLSIGQGDIDLRTNDARRKLVSLQICFMCLIKVLFSVAALKKAKHEVKCTFGNGHLFMAHLFN